jgi:hypothetical protein
MNRSVLLAEARQQRQRLGPERLGLVPDVRDLPSVPATEEQVRSDYAAYLDETLALIRRTHRAAAIRYHARRIEEQFRG